MKFADDVDIDEADPVKFEKRMQLIYVEGKRYGLTTNADKTETMVLGPNEIPRGQHKMRSGADLNGDNLRISTAYLRISDHCRVTVRVRVRVRNRVRVSIRVRVSVRVGVAECCIQTAGKVSKCGSIT